MAIEYCPQCGAKLTEQATYCHVCGTKIDIEGSESQESPGSWSQQALTGPESNPCTRREESRAGQGWGKIAMWGGILLIMALVPILPLIKESERERRKQALPPSSAGNPPLTQTQVAAASKDETPIVYSSLIVAADKANIRSGPEKGYDPIAQGKRGDSFAVKGREGDWYKIDYQGRDAWIHKTAVHEPLKVQAEEQCTIRDPTGEGKTGLLAITEGVDIALEREDALRLSQYVVCGLYNGDKVTVDVRGKAIARVTVLSSQTCAPGTRGMVLAPVLNCEEARQEEVQKDRSLSAQRTKQGINPDELTKGAKGSRPTATLQRDLDRNINNKDLSGYKVKGWLYKAETREFIVYVQDGNKWALGNAMNPLFPPVAAVVAGTDFIFGDHGAVRPRVYIFKEGPRELFKADL